ncbi:hypothetical protein COCON_G00075330 [Conger conger]|uniref:ER membrane protein complex subunit 6 n=1 Tax=Conger conger TaxID=82655 RepID=A0A9Q1I1E7_CONCO|nr:hypothetical protein COCON_G00075330 [Conger conger]
MAALAAKREGPQFISEVSVRASFLLSLLLILKAGRRWNKCFKSRRLLFTGGLVGGLFTYILFWTFLYGMVHVY